MNQHIVSEHHTDDDGNPAGGHTDGIGIEITWQDGPIALLEAHDPETCPCGAPATWTYDPETMATTAVTKPTPFCEEHGPNSLPRVPQNGAFVEGVIAAAIDRLEHYQSSKFRCRENALAITKLEEALHWLGHRTARRTSDGTEGTHQGA